MRCKVKPTCWGLWVIKMPKQRLYCTLFHLPHGISVFLSPAHLISNLIYLNHNATVDSLRQLKAKNYIFPRCFPKVMMDSVLRWMFMDAVHSSFAHRVQNDQETLFYGARKTEWCWINETWAACALHSGHINVPVVKLQEILNIPLLKQKFGT